MSFTAETLLSMYAPTLATDPSAPNWLQLGRESYSSSVLGSSYEEVVALFAAHRMTLVARALSMPGAVGTVTSQSVGSISQSYSAGTPRAGYEDLNQTSYGVRLQNLLLMAGASMAVLSAGDDLPGAGLLPGRMLGPLYP